MEIYIMSRGEAIAYSRRPHTDRSIVISISDVERIPPNICCNSNNIKDILPLFFDDVEKGQDFCITSTDANKIVNFVNKWNGKISSIVVHCEAGISRSAGVAGAIGKWLNNDDSFAFSGIHRPNMTCYRMVLNAFARDREMREEQR